MGEYTYTSTQNRKYFNIVGQLLDVLTEMGQPAALGNAFSTISLLQTAKKDYNTTIVAVQGRNKHFY